jgi:hypothetical protein
MQFAGELAADAVWSGRVSVSGDVVVPAGRTLRVLAGSELVFAPRPSWTCAVFRSAPEGYPIETSSRQSCDLVVFGRLEIEGTDERPVKVSRAGEPWGGVTLLERGEASVEHARIVGAGDAQESLFQCFDDSRLELLRCALESARVGVLAWGLSSVRVQKSVVEDVGCAFLCREGSTTDLFETDCRRAEQGVWAQNWALARLENCRFEDCSVFGAGAYDRSRMSVTRGFFGSSRRGILGATRADVNAVGVEFRDNGVGVEGIESSRVSLADCVIGSGDVVAGNDARVAVTGRTA